MNAEEMADNPQLGEHIVHSLNDNATLPYDDAQFDAVLCTVSVQYLTNPIAVFSDVNRVLKPGGSFIVSFSNRCFPTKAVAIWLNMTDMQHVALVASYFEAAQFININTALHTKGKHDPLFIISGQKTE
jgi:ubiquinone/menaquinone biosynthesis C-methylase UbiE